MLTIVFKADQLLDAAERFEHGYAQAVQEMKALLDEKAEEQRATHAYQNQTGDLEASTFAGPIVATGDGHQVEFGARMFYAPYVNRRGLMRIDELAAEAEVELAYLFDGLALLI